MKLCIFVHDLIPEVGHSRALIELINGIEDKSQVTSISAVCLKASQLEILFKDFKCEKKLYLIPGNKIKPFLLKAIWYHIIAFIYSKTTCKDHFKIGIGIASFNVDLSNIQFIHQQWSDKYFKIQKMNFLSYLYKKILFSYFHICEDIFFSNPKRKYIVIAKFMKEYLIQQKKIDENRIILLPSAVNPNEFKNKHQSKREALRELQTMHPELEKFNSNLPTFLFIGAFERKGLDKALSYFSKFPNSQMLVVGRPEKMGQKINFPDRCIYVSFTKNISLFYEVSDCFIFPTHYEPFGLVIIEAFAMGLDLLVPSDNVGACEILPKVEGVYFFKQQEAIPLITITHLSNDLKFKRRAERINALGEITWNNQAKKLIKFLNI